MHPAVLVALRITFALAGVFFIYSGVREISGGIDLTFETDGRVRPAFEVISIALGIVLLLFSAISEAWRPSRREKRKHDV